MTNQEGMTTTLRAMSSIHHITLRMLLIHLHKKVDFLMKFPNVTDRDATNNMNYATVVSGLQVVNRRYPYIPVIPAFAPMKFFLRSYAQQ